MSFPFNRSEGFIIVDAVLSGPLGTIRVRLALDTGATRTVISVGPLLGVGYIPSSAPDRVRVTTGSGVEWVSEIVVERLAGLDQERSSFPVLAHTLPPSAGVDGLLGLDFLRGQTLTLDFRAGLITLA